MIGWWSKQASAAAVRSSLSTYGTGEVSVTNLVLTPFPFQARSATSLPYFSFLYHNYFSDGQLLLLNFKGVNCPTP